MTPRSTPSIPVGPEAGMHVCDDCGHSEGNHRLDHTACHGTYRSGKCGCSGYREARPEPLVIEPWRELLEAWLHSGGMDRDELGRLITSTERSLGQSEVGYHAIDPEVEPDGLPLDVERLATAMSAVGRSIPGTGFGAYADEVADEYRRIVPPGIDPATDMRYSEGKDPMEARPTPVESEAPWQVPSTKSGRELAVDIANKHDGPLNYWDVRVAHVEDDARRLAVEPEARLDRLIEYHEHWRFFADHPLPWELSDTSAGFAVEDANHEVLWRFDHYDRADVERFVSSLNDVVSVEEVPYIRGYNRGWDDALKEPLAVEPDGLPLDVRLRALRRAVSDGTDPDTGDVWLHREDADGLRDLLWGAPSEDEQPR